MPKRILLLVIDEVQTGFGRTGKMFAFEWEEVIPDIVITSKGISGGFAPIALTIIRKDILNNTPPVLSPEANTVSVDMTSLFNCAVGSASIVYITENNLVGKVARKGAYFKERLERIAKKFPRLVIGVRGRGLMLGMKLRNNVVEYSLWLQLLKRGVIGGLSTNLTTKNPVMRIFPNLTISYEEINEACILIENSLLALRKKPLWFLDLNNALFKYQFHLPFYLLKTGKKLLITKWPYPSLYKNN